MENSKLYTDAALLAAIGKKDDLNQAIRYVYQQYADTISSFIIKNNGTQQDAEDVFQETVVNFIDIVRKNKYRGESSIKTFLVAIARNIWLNELNKKERSGYRDKVFESTREDKEDDISHLISDREVKHQFRQIIDKLGEPCKKILLLFYYDNFSMKEMVAHLPYENEQVVRNKKYKCLQRLAELLKEVPALARNITMRN